MIDDSVVGNSIIISLNLYLHEGSQVGVVVIQGGDDVELYFDHDPLAQVILSGNSCQSMQQFNLGGPVRERKKGTNRNYVAVN